MNPHASDRETGNRSIAIMQPYLFPYIGYYQLAASVHRLVFLDDVNYIKRGWINRNRLIFSGSPRYFTVPVSNASQFKKISDIEICPATNWQKKLCTSISQSYGKAPYFRSTFEAVNTVLNSGETRISEMAKMSIQVFSEMLDLPTKFVHSSSIYNNDALMGADRIIDICRKEHATLYYNLPNGAGLYDKATFAEYGIQISFLPLPEIEYPQFSRTFHPSLSMIDVMMFNPIEKIKRLLLDKPINPA